MTAISKLLKSRIAYKKYYRDKCRCGSWKGKASKTCRKCFKLKITGGGNPYWKGKDISYGGIHAYIMHKIKRPKRCESCNQIRRLDAANISGKYKRDSDDWKFLCRKCHMIDDGRLNKLKIRMRKLNKDHPKSKKV